MLYRWSRVVVFGVLFLLFFRSSDAYASEKSEAGCVGEAREALLALWEVFDLLNACRVAPPERVDFETNCCLLSRRLLVAVSYLVDNETLEAADIISLYDYFLAMSESFENSCLQKTPLEQRLASFFAIIRNIFLMILPEPQKMQEQDMPSRCCVVLLPNP